MAAVVHSGWRWCNIDNIEFAIIMIETTEIVAVVHASYGDGAE
jgi:hypothetical protein